MFGTPLASQVGRLYPLAVTAIVFGLISRRREQIFNPAYHYTMVGAVGPSASDSVVAAFDARRPLGVHPLRACRPVGTGSRPPFPLQPLSTTSNCDVLSGGTANPAEGLGAWGRPKTRDHKHGGIMIMNKRRIGVTFAALTLLTVAPAATAATASTTPITNTYSCAPFSGGQICVGVDHAGSYVEDAQVQLYYSGSISNIYYWIDAPTGPNSYNTETPTPHIVSGSGWLDQGNLNVRKNQTGKWCGIADEYTGSDLSVQACVTIS